MLLPELQRLAGELGITGTGRMRKGDLVAAISARQVGSGAAGERPADSGSAGADSTVTSGTVATAAPLEAPISGGANAGPLTESAAPEPAPTGRSRRGARRPAGSPSVDTAAPDTAAPDTAAPDTASSEAGSTAGTATAPAAPDTVPADGEQRTDGERPPRNRERGGRNRNDRGDRDGNDRGG